MYDESYFSIQRWEDQTGEWYELNEARDADEARTKVAELQSENPEANYSIVYFQRTVVKAGNPR